MAIPANLAVVHFVILRRLHFCLGFSVSADPRDGFPRDSSLIISLLSVAGFSVLTTASCDEDVDEVGEDEVEGLVDRRGTTDGSLHCNCFFAILGEMWFLTTGPAVGKPMILAEHSE